MSELLDRFGLLHVDALPRGLLELQLSRADYLRLRETVPGEVDRLLGYAVRLNASLPEHVVAFIGRDRQLLGWINLRSGLMHMRRLYAPKVP